jgi:CDP-4-dehydro-6-deoxyglucose reductase
METWATVLQVTPLTDTILQLMLKPLQYIDYHAGQYLQLLTDDDVLSYSIANAPLGSRHYELHIRHSADNESTQRLLTDIKRTGRVMIRLPLGTCDVTNLDPNKPTILIAGGIGFAPIKAILEQMLADGRSTPIELYWGARARNDLYFDDQVMRWQSHVQALSYFHRLSDASQKNIVSMVLARHRRDLPMWQVVINGPFDMVYSARDKLVARGLPVDAVFSDAFSFE